MSRRPPDESTFGSDSFLDIIANIVGILIILIVVAGVRVSRAPAVSSQVESPETAVLNSDVSEFIQLRPNLPLAEEIPLDAEVFEEPSVLESNQANANQPSVPDFVPPSEVSFPEIPVVVPPSKLVEESSRLELTLQSKTRAVQDLAKEIESLEAESAKASQTEMSLREDLAGAMSNLQNQEQEAQALTKENEQSQQLVEVIQQKLRDVDRSEPEAKKLAHRLNPVGRVVSGREVHFRLTGDKVSYLPVEELSQLVKQDMQRRRDFLLKQQRFQSTVGPVNGFEMEYLVQRATGSILDEVRYGPGIIRVGVTDWVLHPTENVIEESIEEALKTHSQFRAALITGGSNATITFWVYPDSFDLHHELKNFVHDSGFWVASRPLPTGFPIAGSASGGSKSIAQ